MTAQERVALGAAWLDETEGPEWVDRINLDDLKMTDACGCICGQTFRAEAEAAGNDLPFQMGYWYAHEHRFPAVVDKFLWATEHGFHGRSVHDFAVLRRAWSDLILKRRGPNAERVSA